MKLLLIPICFFACAAPSFLNVVSPPKRDAFKPFKGVKGFIISTVSVLKEKGDTFDENLTEDEIKDMIELKLRSSGIPVVRSGGDVKDYSPWPRLNADFTFLTTPGGAYAYTCKFDTTEFAYVDRGANKELIDATTWDRATIVVAGKSRVRQGMKDNIDDMMTKLCLAYLKDNQKD